MFAVKSEYCIQPSRDVTIPFYVAGNNVYFKRADITNAIYGSLFGVVIFSSFENYDDDFVSFIECRNLFLENPPRFINRDFWRNTFNQDYSKVIAEVRDASKFIKDFTLMDLPDDWTRLNVDAIIDTLPSRTSDWIEKCHNSLRILATNDEQKQLAHRVYDEAWKILKEREKADNKYTALHEVLAKFGLTDDDLINATLDAHKAKFDKQHDELESELRMLLKEGDKHD